MADVSYLTAFAHGFLTFFSPCVIPLLPLYFSYLAGEALNANNDKKVRAKLIVNSIGFILGLSLLNLMIGFGAKFLSDVLIRNKDIIRIIGGILVIAFGLYFVSGMKIPFLEKDRKLVYTRYSPNFLKSLLLGFTFSLGWSACNGPIVASITLIAAFQQDYLKAGTLMLVYSAGFSVLFLLSAVLAGTFVKKMHTLKPYLGVVKIISGSILIIMGILMLADKVYYFS